MAPDPHQILFNPDSYSSQAKCPLFSILSGELRNQIFQYALTEYEDHTRAYHTNTCFKRPNQQAPRRLDTSLLRTCQRIYNEAWFRPWTSSSHHMWLAWAGRRPHNSTTAEKLRPILQQLADRYGEIELGHFYISAQLCSLEASNPLNQILQLDNFHPSHITIVIRHTDWWNWETDAPLVLRGAWVNHCILPNSVRVLSMELESLERKKIQVDNIATGMAKSWRFKRFDGSVLSPVETERTITRWTGSSIWEGSRWIRDETKPDLLDYYVLTLPFKLMATNANDTREGSNQTLPLDRVAQPGPMNANARLSVHELRSARVPRGTNGDAAQRMIADWRSGNRPGLQGVDDVDLEYLSMDGQRSAREPIDLEEEDSDLE